MVPQAESLLEYILIHYRWVLVCVFLLPLSLFYDIYYYIRNYIVFKLNSAPKQHEAKVKYIQKQVRKWAASGKKTHMCTARPGWQTVSFRTARYKSTYFNVEVNLIDIVDVDVDKQIVRVEPMVTMGQLTATLISLGWSIPVVPEIDELTVGGLVMGTGIETTSHKYGLFQHICLTYELVLSDGSVVKCSKEDHSELFYAVPWSYGTLGILTAVEIKMIPIKKYIQLTYRPFKNMNLLIADFQKCINNEKYEFVEGIIFNKKQGVVMTGFFVEDAKYEQVNCIGKWYKPWFYKHVESFLSRDVQVTEYIPLRHYYHRHTKSLFWELQDIIPFGNNAIFRAALGWMMPPRISLLKLTQTEAVKKLYENHHVFQDMLVPIHKLKESIHLFHDTVEVYPLWLCPFLLQPGAGMVHSSSSVTEMYVDIGVYGIPMAAHYHPRETTRVIEKYVAEIKGFQMLYADTYTTREEFRKMFDHTLYDQVRSKLNCQDAFPEVYDKVKKEARY